MVATDPLKERSSARGRILLSVAAALSLAFLLFAVYRDNHIHFSPQSRQCAIAARSLLDRGTMELHPGRPYATFGALYPALLAAMGSLQVSLADSIMLINSAALSLSVLTFFWISREVGLPRPGIVTAFYAGLAINPYLFRMARADIIFVFATMLMVLELARFAGDGRRRHLLIAALACILATTARYMGIFVLGPLCVYVFGRIRRPRSKREWADAIGFLLLAWVPVSIWLVRNKILTGHFSGMSREDWYELSASWNPMTNLLDIMKTMAYDFLGIRVMGVLQVVTRGDFTPYRTPTRVLIAAFAGLLVIGIALWLVARIRARTKAPREEKSAPGRSSALLAIIGAYVLLYFAAMVIVWSWGNIDPISTRYAAPSYWGIVILAAYSWALLRRQPGAALLRAVLLAGAVIGFAVNVDKSVRLFGEYPGEELIQKTIVQGGDTWLRNPTWSREARFAPPQVKDRVVDEEAR